MGKTKPARTIGQIATASDVRPRQCDNIDVCTTGQESAVQSPVQIPRLTTTTTTTRQQRLRRVLLLTRPLTASRDLCIHITPTQLTYDHRAGKKQLATDSIDPDRARGMVLVTFHASG